MIVYRLAIEQYCDDLSGTGSKLFGGRWNHVGTPVVYTTENISLSVLEILVRTGKTMVPLNYMLISIEIPDSITPTLITKSKLKKDWKEDIDNTQFIGTEFARNNQSVILKVPSAVVDEEHNYILNPAHPDMKKVKIKQLMPFRFDKRFFLIHE